MKKLSIFLSAMVLGTIGYAQYCTSGGPSSTNDSELGAISLNGATYNINIGQTCPGVVGVDDLTATQAADLIAGNSYSLSVQFSGCGSTYGGAGEAWIDWNMDQTFSSGESIGTWSGSSTPSTQIFNFTVPSYVCVGATRLRVMQDEGGSLPLNPCSSFDWGSVMDFTIDLSGGSCQIPGCTDPLASNYNPSAVIDDGSCVFANQQDCEGATVICNTVYYEPVFNFPGDGDIPDEVPNSSCLGSGEKNSLWYTFTSYKTGDLGFSVCPNVQDEDYDWAVYDITDNGCAGIPTGASPELSCNYAPNVCQGTGDGCTGPNGVLTGPCAGQNEPMIQVDSGRTYAIIVSQFEDITQNGFSIVFDTASVIYGAQMKTQDFKGCYGDSIELSILSFVGPDLGEIVYRWFLPDSSWYKEEEKPYSFVLDSTVDLVVSVTNRDCDLSDTVTIEVAKVEANFGWEFEDNGFPNPVTFSDSSTGALSLTWLFGDSTNNEQTLTGVTFDHTYEEPGYYDVTQIALNKNFNCDDTITILVPMPFLLPNIITPNGDGENDLFIIKGLRRYSVLDVFNQWGRRVLKVEDEYDGTWDGGNLPDGNYFYVVTEPGSKGASYKGWLRISR